VPEESKPDAGRVGDAPPPGEPEVDGAPPPGEPEGAGAALPDERDVDGATPPEVDGTPPPADGPDGAGTELTEPAGEVLPEPTGAPRSSGADRAGPPPVLRAAALRDAVSRERATARARARRSRSATVRAETRSRRSVTSEAGSERSGTTGRGGCAVGDGATRMRWAVSGRVARANAAANPRTSTARAATTRTGAGVSGTRIARASRFPGAGTGPVARVPPRAG
jgi:hypothetical protein